MNNSNKSNNKGRNDRSQIYERTKNILSNKCVAAYS